MMFNKFYKVFRQSSVAHIKSLKFCHDGYSNINYQKILQAMTGLRNIGYEFPFMQVSAFNGARDLTRKVLQMEKEGQE